MSLLSSSVFANPTQSFWAPAGTMGTAFAVDWVWASGNSPTYSPLQVTSLASPSPSFTFLQARRSEPGPNPTQTFYGRFDSNGSCFLEYAWDGFVYLPLFLRGRPITILGDNSAVLRLTDETTGGTGVLTVDASNNLFWNGTQLN